MALELVQVACRGDNYAVLIHDKTLGVTAVVDTPAAEPIMAALEQRGWAANEIWTTHHHGDHTEGHLALKARYGSTIIGPRAEADKIPGIDKTVSDGTNLRFAGRDVLVIATPGHTLGHVAYYIPDEGVAFVGDTLFAMGCGRVMEGTMDDMWRSVRKLADLPAQTLIYCGHEYTAANARFSLSIEPNNPDLKARAAHVEQLRAKGLATIPTTIGLELLTNPFVRAELDSVKEAVGMAGKPASAVFAELRERKNRA
jgi:hydroxyacylglutathione hydrolase